MSSENKMVKKRQCFKCGYYAETQDAKCPDCGKPLHQSGAIRLRGLLLAICGGFLAAFMGYLTIWVLNAMTTDGTSGSARFNGTREQSLMILGLFGSIIVFGVVAFVTGLWQLIFGRRNKLFVWGTVGLGILVFVSGFGCLWLFGK